MRLSFLLLDETGNLSRYLLTFLSLMEVEPYPTILKPQALPFRKNEENTKTGEEFQGKSYLDNRCGTYACKWVRFARLLF